MLEAKMEIEELGVTVTKDFTGYILFSRSGEHLLGLLSREGRHHVIIKGKPSVSIEEGKDVVDLICGVLGEGSSRAKALVAGALWKDWC